MQCDRGMLYGRIDRYEGCNIYLDRGVRSKFGVKWFLIYPEIFVSAL